MKKVWYLLLAVCLVACENTPEIENEAELEVTPQAAAYYVDLGLTSGTKWKMYNETAKEKGTGTEVEFFTYNQAIKYYGANVPTKDQWQELIDECQWTWDDTKKGYNIVGPNSKSIFLPAKGWIHETDGLINVGHDGIYWTATAYDKDYAWYIYTNPGQKEFSWNDRTWPCTLILVWK